MRRYGQEDHLINTLDLCPIHEPIRRRDRYFSTRLKRIVFDRITIGEKCLDPTLTIKDQEA